MTCEPADAKCGPSLPTATLEAIESRVWTFPADLPVDALETRLAARISTAFGLDVERVSVDAQGRASVAATRSTTSVATQLPDGKRALTVETTVPAGLAADDRVSLAVEEESVNATVLAVAPARNGAQSQRGRRMHRVDSRSRRQVETVTRGAKQLGVVIGVYVVSLSFILVPLAVALEDGFDWPLLGYRIGRSLLGAVPIYVVTVVVGATF